MLGHISILAVMFNDTIFIKKVDLLHQFRVCCRNGNTFSLAVLYSFLISLQVKASILSAYLRRILKVPSARISTHLHCDCNYFMIARCDILQREQFFLEPKLTGRGFVRSLANRNASFLLSHTESSPSRKCSLFIDLNTLNQALIGYAKEK